MSDSRKEEDIKEIVIARLKRAPEGISISFGGLGSEPISTQQLIDHVQRGDEIGQKIMEVQMRFLTSFKEGLLYE